MLENVTQIKSGMTTSVDMSVKINKASRMQKTLCLKS